jgi:hypothetical protein
MKKIILVITLLIVVSLTVQSQTFVNQGGSELTQSNLFNPIDIMKVSAWSPFTDSSATYYSVPFDVSKYDSIDCWIRSTSVWGVPDFKTELLVAFDNTNFTTAVIGTVADTVSAKTEVLTHYGKVGTAGATKGKLKLTPVVTGAATTACNRTDAIINYIFICHRRLN